MINSIFFLYGKIYFFWLILLKFIQKHSLLLLFPSFSIEKLLFRRKSWFNRVFMKKRMTFGIVTNLIIKKLGFIKYFSIIFSGLLEMGDITFWSVNQRIIWLGSGIIRIWYFKAHSNSINNSLRISATTLFKKIRRS